MDHPKLTVSNQEEDLFNCLCGNRIFQKSFTLKVYNCVKYAEYEYCAILHRFFLHFPRFNSNIELVIDLLSALHYTLLFKY